MSHPKGHRRRGGRAIGHAGRPGLVPSAPPRVPVRRRHTPGRTYRSPDTPLNENAQKLVGTLTAEWRPYALVASLAGLPNVTLAAAIREAIAAGVVEKRCRDDRRRDPYSWDYRRRVEDE